MSELKKKRISSREKGKRGERDAAKYLRETFNTHARRGVQYSGSPDSPDVVFDSRLHIEVKYTQTLNLDRSLEQAKRDALPEQIPVVMHRKNGKTWKFTVEAEHVKEFAAIIDSYNK